VSDSLRVAAVLPAGGELALLDGALAALRAQDRRLDELIVVDDTRDGSLPAPDGVRVLRSGGRGPYAARNAGWRATDADVVLFCDLRSRPRPEWARRIAELFEDPSVAVAGSEVLVSGGDSLAARAGERHQFFELRKYIEEPVVRPYFPTCNLAVRRADLEAVGGFEEIRSGADAILCWRILDRPGRRLAAVREVLMDWIPRDRIRGYLEQNYRYGKSHHAFRTGWRGESVSERRPLSHLMLARRATGATVRSAGAAIGGDAERRLELLRHWGWISYELGLRVAVDRDRLRGPESR
jgi:glycosyltransferase involved in cell wall biosynthesis